MKRNGIYEKGNYFVANGGGYPLGVEGMVEERETKLIPFVRNNIVCSFKNSLRLLSVGGVAHRGDTESTPHHTSKRRVEGKGRWKRNDHKNRSGSVGNLSTSKRASDCIRGN